MHKNFWGVATFIMLIALFNPILASASAGSSSDKLFEFAEKNFSQYFKPSGTNSFGIENYLVRYYSKTNTFLGTLGSEVYVYGDAFGGLLRVGRINDFISTPVRIDTFKPGTAYSGIEVTITGDGFTQDQVVLIGNQNARSRFISEKEIRFTVPFVLNEKKELIPLQAGPTVVQIGDSNQVVIQLIDLPENKNPPGEIIRNYINTSFDRLSNSLAEFNSVLPSIMVKYQDDTSTVDFFQNLKALATELNSKGSSELIEESNNIPSESLNSIERALLTVQQSSDSALPVSKITSVAQQDPDSCHGDAWLACRQGFALVSRATNYEGKIIAACLELVAGVSIVTGGTAFPTLATTCASLGLMNAIADTLHNAIVANKFGIIKTIKIHLSDESSGTNLVLNLNNADNNQETPSSNALVILGAELAITNDIRGGQILSTLVDTVKEITKVDIVPVPSKLREFAANWVDNLSTSDFNDMVTPATLQHILSDLKLSEFSFAELLFDRACTIKTGNSIAVEFPENGSSNWLPIVPDQGTELLSTMVGSCQVKIAEEFRMSAEDDVFATLDLHVTRHPKIRITKEDGIEKIEYSPLSYFGNSSCSNSSCEEYFDRSKVAANDFLNLEATSHATYWTGLGADDCPDRVNCLVFLDNSNYQSPNIVAHSYSGTWSAHVTDDETKCEEGVSSYDRSAIVTVNGNELSINVRPVSWSGSLHTNPNSVSYNVNFSEDGGTTSEHGSVNFNKGTFSGSSTWSWTDGDDSCSGTSIFSGSKN